MSNHILCFSWNTDQIPLCEAYLENNTINLITKSRGTFSKTTPCYNALFFDNIQSEIINHSPNIVVFFTENDLESGTWFHSDLLPNKMKNLKYKLLSRDKYSSIDKYSGLQNNKQTDIRMSIFIKDNDNITKNIELSKGMLFNDNKMECSTSNNNYVENAKIMTLYTQNSIGKIAFVGIQYAENTPSDGRICVKQLEDKFINNKGVDYVFIMGDFSNTYDKTVDFITKPYDKYLETQKNIEMLGETYTKGPLFSDLYDFKQEDKINYNNLVNFKLNSVPENYDTGDREDNLLDYGNRHTLYKYTYLSDSMLGYHDRIFYRTFNIYDKHIKCLKYKQLWGEPMQKKSLNSKHIGILGVYQIF